MSGHLRLFLAPALLLVLAGVVPSRVEPHAMIPDSSPAQALASGWQPEPQPAITAAEGQHDLVYRRPLIEVEPLHVTPPQRKQVRSYGPVPALTGAILLTGGKYIGVPYVHGGTTSSGFDCSGFVQKVYAENGITIPRTTSGIRNAGTVTTTPKPGDIMYWSAGHVALYVAPGWRLDANRPGSTVQIRPSYGNPIYLTF